VSDKMDVGLLLYCIHSFWTFIKIRHSFKTQFFYPSFIWMLINSSRIVQGW